MELVIQAKQKETWVSTNNVIVFLSLLYFREKNAFCISARLVQK